MQLGSQHVAGDRVLASLSRRADWIWNGGEWAEGALSPDTDAQTEGLPSRCGHWCPEGGSSCTHRGGPGTVCALVSAAERAPEHTPVAAARTECWDARIAGTGAHTPRRGPG